MVIVELCHCGLLRKPKVYNALITTDQNITPSRSYPIIQPHLHEGIAYGSYPFGGYNSFGGIYDSYSQQYPFGAPALAADSGIGGYNIGRNNFYPIPEQPDIINENSNSGDQGIQDENENVGIGGEERSNAQQESEENQNNSNEENQNQNKSNEENAENETESSVQNASNEIVDQKDQRNKGVSENSPIPLNEFGLPPNLIPFNPYDYPQNPVNLSPYPYNSYPLIYDQYGGYNVNPNPYLPPFGYYPGHGIGGGVVGAGPFGAGSVRKNQINNNKKSSKPDSPKNSNKIENEKSTVYQASNNDNHDQSEEQNTNRPQASSAAAAAGNITNYIKKNKDIPDVPPPPLPSGAKTEE